MLRTTLGVVALHLLAAIAAGQNYVVDPAHTSVVFSVGHMGYSFTYGMFREPSGTVTWGPAADGPEQFDLKVKVASIDTGNEARDAHLRNPDFFDAEKFPEIRFVGKAQAAQQDDKGRTIYPVDGQMTLHGVTRKLTLPIRLLKRGENHQGAPTVGFHCEAVIKRSDYGMDASLGPISDNIGVTFSFEAVARQP